MENKIYEYNGFAVRKERDGANCGGHFDNESCIHIKFGHPFKYSSFTDDFINKHDEFIKLYDKLGNMKKPSRAKMLKLGKMIIALHDKKELIVVFNMVDCEAASPLSIAYYVMLETAKDYAYNFNELINDNEFLADPERN